MTSVWSLCIVAVGHLRSLLLRRLHTNPLCFLESIVRTWNALVKHGFEPKS